ncbi:hypothetical protein MKW92_004713 [Papaver armeniacum]|nr:hypothetical protein MKW92_004713 [Papaver armeniacum]
MDELLLPGSLGTSASLTLMIGTNYFLFCFSVVYVFCYLVTVMGLVLPWSFTLAMVDAYSLCAKCPLRQPGILWIIIMGDWQLQAAVIDLLLQNDGSYCPPKFCSRYQFSAAMAFLSWILTAASSLFNLWVIPSL